MLESPSEPRPVPGGLDAVRGIQAAGVHCGIKGRNPDLAVVVTHPPAVAAGTFTTNRVQAAPVVVSREHLARGGLVRAIVVNSGIANACTGEQGLADARRMAAVLAERLGAAPQEVLVASTGVIGQSLPMEKVEAGIQAAVEQVRAGGGADAARAICTTDTRIKQAAVKVSLRGGTVRVGGMAKGSGMIHPNMATMLAFVATDAAVEREWLEERWRRSVAASYNRITVDGDTSTNDMALVLANGASGVRPDGPGEEALLGEALDQVNLELARMIAADGEGASHLMVVRVTGAASPEEADRCARTIAASPLVKTAVAGRDPNWGRILAAAGRSGVTLDPSRLDLWIGGVQVAAGGAGRKGAEEAARARMEPFEVEIRLDLGSGPHEGLAFGCDLTEGYVRINAEYRS
ncbi:ornithine acetyltransferase [Limnochorda pilosa]|uniref:Arginine biosynthesis bifunctional protein ArgJ n=1 Tax=Limnochorda pilosa TaxID=1555112 RepID=A0A0K2SJ35_LIMPI|nr:ornithine acetyltransferase [Limnochorda pilosa]